jgi:hypothetical protein
MKRFAAAVVVAMGVVGALAPAALGDGGPPISVSVGGVAAPDGKSVYDAIPSGRHSVAMRISSRSDRVVRYRSLSLGGLGIPAVGLYRPTPDGLSPDGRTLILQRPYSFRRGAHSTFAVVDSRTLRVERVIRLRGAFGFDGLSPDGGRMYLVQYPSPLNDPAHYLVRSYDLRADRLASKPIVDPSDEEQMRGLPVTRATTADGRWAYTLYTGPPGDKAPFIHALDLEHGAAKCIDLPRSVGTVYQDHLRLTRGGSTLTVVSKRQGPMARVDTRTFEVSTPAGSSGPTTTDGGSGFPWLLLALGGGLIVGVASLWGMPRLHRRRLAGTDE